MVSRFYAQHSRKLLWIVVCTFPFLVIQSGKLPTNNRVETWLPGHSDVRVTYDRFREYFGAEEVILVAAPGNVVESGDLPYRRLRSGVRLTPMSNTLSGPSEAA